MDGPYSPAPVPLHWSNGLVSHAQSPMHSLNRFFSQERLFGKLMPNIEFVLSTSDRPMVLLPPGTVKAVVSSSSQAATTPQVDEAASEAEVIQAADTVRVGPAAQSQANRKHGRRRDSRGSGFKQQAGRRATAALAHPRRKDSKGKSVQKHGSSDSSRVQLPVGNPIPTSRQGGNSSAAWGWLQGIAQAASPLISSFAAPSRGSGGPAGKPAAATGSTLQAASVTGGPSVMHHWLSLIIFIAHSTQNHIEELPLCLTVLMG